MKVSELWLKTLIKPALTTAELAEQLTMAGLEVDNIEQADGEAQDSILTLKIPANRGDCLSMEGVARELSALNRLPYQWVQFKTETPNINEVFPVRVEAKEACSQYVGRIVQNINTDATTPAWIQQRLQAAAIRSISPVVDVCNYVMLELGQPLHAFDLDKISKEIVVRFANNQEKIVTLDEVEIALDPDTLIIADAKQPLAIAGIIGGMDSSVQNNTTNIFLESAYFDPVHIRRSSKRLKVRTDSSIRFERGLDPNLQVRALERASQLLQEIVGGNLGPIIIKTNHEALPKAHTVFLRRSKIHNVLGITLEDQEILDIFRSLEMDSKLMAEGFEVTVPAFRVDIGLEEDLIEEIARIYGYHKFPSTMPISIFESQTTPETKIPAKLMKQAFIDRGYCETITYSFVSEEFLNLLSPIQKSLKLSNPISAEMAHMRTSLWPGLIQVAIHNQRRQQIRLRLFEMSSIFLEQNQHWHEKNVLSGLCSAELYPEQWGNKKIDSDFFDVKGDLEAIFALTKDPDFHFKPIQHPALHPSQSAEIFRGSESVGCMGLLHPQIMKKLELIGPVFLFELELEFLLQKEMPQYKEFSKYPSIRRDLAIIVKNTVPAEELKTAILKMGGSLLKEVHIFDVYQGKGIEPGSKSVALGLILQHPSRTLVETEVNEVIHKILMTLEKEFQASLRT